MAAQEASGVLPPDVLAEVDPAVFKDAICVTNHEASYLLAKYMQQKRDQHGPTWQPPTVVKKTQEYVDRMASGKNQEQSRAQRSFLESQNLREYELVLLCNLAPETPEEAMAYVPSLKEEGRFTEEDLTRILGDAAMYQSFQ